MAGLSAVGYEIHLGETSGAVPPLLRLAERQGRAVDEPDGAIGGEGWLAGTYLHGFFDSPPLRGAILRNLAARKGVASHPDWGRAPRHDPFDRLAQSERIVVRPVPRPEPKHRPRVHDPSDRTAGIASR